MYIQPQLDPKQAYKVAVAAFGGVTKLANSLGITRQAVHAWGGVVDQYRAYQIEVVTSGAITRDFLRPDLPPTTRVNIVRPAVYSVNHA